MDLILLAVRLLLGLGMAAHGSQKLFGWFGGHGLEGTGGLFEQLGFRPGRLFAAAASLGETGSGALVALGLLGPVGPAIMLLVMIVAALAVHRPNGFFAANNGVELAALYGAGALLLAFTGPGAFSLDAVLGLSGLWTPRLDWTAVAAAVLLAGLNVVSRRPVPAPTKR